MIMRQACSPIYRSKFLVSYSYLAWSGSKYASSHPFRAEEKVRATERGTGGGGYQDHLVGVGHPERHVFGLQQLQCSKGLAATLVEGLQVGQSGHGPLLERPCHLLHTRPLLRAKDFEVVLRARFPVEL